MNRPATLNLLIAYPYFSVRLFDRVRSLPFSVRVLIDSGAYTAWNTGRKITLDGYCTALEKLPIQAWRYFALDVVNDIEGTRRNLDEMIRRGFRPSPVLTPSDSIDRIDDYFTVSDLIGIATYKPRRYKRDQQARLINAMAKVDGRMAHLLGMTSMNWVKLHRPYSIDSSTWLNGRKYGSMRLYVGRGRTRQITRESITRGLDAETEAAIVRLGFDPHELRHPLSWEYGKKKGGSALVSRINCASWVLTALQMERAIGTATFFVVADSVIESLLDGWETALRSDTRMTTQCT